jgi:hypothetical protein
MTYNPASVHPSLLIAAVVPPAALGLIAPIRFGAEPDYLITLGLLPFVYLYSVVLTFSIGIPAFLLGLWLRLVRWWSSLVIGFGGGILATIAIRLPRVALGPVDEWLPLALIGALTGFVFWLSYCWLEQRLAVRSEREASAKS